MKRLLILAALALAACSGPKADDFATCPAAAPAQNVLDHFVAAFNARDMPSLEKTFHFPHLRISSYPLQVLTGPGQQDDVFGSLASEGWARSSFENRKIIQCGEKKAHITATFVRYKQDGTAYAKYDGLYVIELRDGFWGITARSTFAP